VAVANNETLRDNLTLAIGPRIHLKADRFWARPGVSITVPLRGAMVAQRLVVVQFDLPVIFF